MSLLDFTLAELRCRPGRTILTMIATVVGVATVVAVLLGTAGSRQAIQSLSQTVAGNADGEVVSTTGVLFEASVAETLAQVPGVAAVSPVFDSQTLFYRDNNRVAIRLLGLDPQRDAAFRELHFRVGEFPQRGELALTPALADRFAIQQGAELRLLTRRGLKSFRVSGLAEIRGEGRAAMEDAVILSLPEAQRSYVRQGDHISNVLLKYDPQRPAEELRAAVAAVLPAGLRLRDPGSRGELGAQTLVAAERGLQLAGGMALVIAFFISLNAFMMNIAERRRQLAVLRLIGGTRSQVRAEVLLEASLLGLISALLGLPLGILAARGVVSILGTFYQAVFPVPQPDPWTLALGLALGVFASGFAALVPAVQASRVVPMEALTAVERDAGERWLRYFLLVGGGTAVAGLLLILSCLGGILPGSWTLGGMVVWLIGLALTLPAFWSPLSAVASLPLAGVAPLEASLARESLLRRPVRTALTLAVLFLGIAASTGIINSTWNQIGEFRQYVYRSISGDFIIRALRPRREPGMFADLPPELETAVRRLPGITSIEAARFVEVTIRDRSVVAIAREFPPDSPLYLPVQHGDPEDLRRQLRGGEIVVATRLLDEFQLNIGDKLSIDMGAGDQEFRIAAAVDDYIAGGLVIILDKQVAHSRLGIEGTDLLLIRADPPMREALGKQLDNLASESGVLLQTQEQLNGELDQLLAGVEGSLFAIAVVSVALTGFGVVNCLTLNVLEQTREFGTLRAIGMTRRQLRRVVLFQGWLLGLVAVLTGIPAGFLLSYFGALSSLPLMGARIEFAVYPALLFGFALIAWGLIAVAGYIPAVRAARLTPLEALREE